MKDIYRYILFLLIITILSIVRVYSFTGTFRNISVSDGMTDLTVNTIYKDKKGFVWFGTNSYVERFDGIRLKRYSLGFNSNKNNRVYDIKNTPPMAFYVLQNQAFIDITKVRNLLTGFILTKLILE